MWQCPFCGGGEGEAREHAKVCMPWQAQQAKEDKDEAEQDKGTSMTSMQAYDHWYFWGYQD